MATEIHDLLVRIRPEGIDETTEGLGEMGEQFTQSSEETEEATQQLSDFADRFQGAANVVIAGLATVSAGLLSQVPIIGEAASGLFAIIDALALKIDQQLRPALQPVTGLLFDIADAINRAEGPFGSFISQATTAVAGFAALEGAILAFNAAGLAVPSVVGTIVALFGGPLTLAIVGLTALISGLVLAWQTNFLNIQTITMSAINTVRGFFSDFRAFIVPLWNFVINFLTGNWMAAWEGLITFTENVYSAIIQGSANFVGKVLTTIGRFLNRARALFEGFWATVRTGFEVMFDQAAAAAQRGANRIVSTIQTAVNTAIEAIPSFIRSRLGIETVNLGTPFDPRAAEDIAAAGQRRLQRRQRGVSRRETRRNQDLERQVSQLVTAMQNTDVEIPLELDSRELARGVEPLVGEGAVNRRRGGR